MTTRKFHRYVFHYEVLSQTPLEESDLDEAAVRHLLISDRPCSMLLETEHEEIDGQRAAKLLIGQLSAPSFFQIDADGNDVDDETDNEEEEGSQ